MKGLFIIAPGELAILDLPDPRPGPYEALVRMRACGICNSTDWKLIEGQFCPGSYPALLGHESVGEVVEAGAKVRSYRPGDLVLRPGLSDSQVHPTGRRSLWGGFAELGLVRDVWAEQGQAHTDLAHPQQVVPAGTDPCLAVAMITLKESLSCLRATNVRPGQSLGIVGTGPVAEALSNLAKLQGVRHVAVLGRKDEHRRRFLDAGADAYFLEGDEPPASLDHVIEAVGSRAALRRALDACKPRGSVNVYGVAPQAEPYAPQDLSDARSYVGKVSEAEEHEVLLGMMRNRTIRLAGMVDRVLLWTEYRAGFDMVARGAARKVVLQIV